MSSEVTINVKVRVWINLIMFQVWTCWIARAVVLVVLVFYPWIVTFEIGFKRGTLIPVSVKITGEFV